MDDLHQRRVMGFGLITPEEIEAADEFFDAWTGRTRSRHHEEDPAPVPPVGAPATAPRPATVGPPARAPTTVPASPPPALLVLAASVGDGGRNRAADVTQVQRALRYLGAIPQPASLATLASGTEAAIRGIQRAAKLKPDGRIDPRGETSAHVNGMILQRAGIRALPNGYAMPSVPGKCLRGTRLEPRAAVEAVIPPITRPTTKAARACGGAEAHRLLENLLQRHAAAQRRAAGLPPITRPRRIVRKRSRYAKRKWHPGVPYPVEVPLLLLGVKFHHPAWRKTTDIIDARLGLGLAHLAQFLAPLGVKEVVHKGTYYSKTAHFRGTAIDITGLVIETNGQRRTILVNNAWQTAKSCSHAGYAWRRLPPKLHPKETKAERRRRLLRIQRLHPERKPREGPLVPTAAEVASMSPDEKLLRRVWAFVRHELGITVTPSKNVQHWDHIHAEVKL